MDQLNEIIDLVNIPSYFKNSAEALKFFEDLGENDSGVEELPFSHYNFTDTTEPDFDFSCLSNSSSKITYGDDDEISFIDDDQDADYQPNKTSSKKGHSKLKRRQYPNTGSSRGLSKHELLTPEKQIISRTGVGQMTMRHYNRKDRTPNTIRKMMEKHRENERVRHHSLNESLKDISMRVPGYDPESKETKIVQMQRIIGYECFLENTLRKLCQKLDVSLKVLLKGNTQFISDAMENIPFEDLYMSRMFRVEDPNEETDRATQSISDDQDLPPGCRIIKPASIEDNILKYRREKISSPTVDSTTDHYVQLVPLIPVNSSKKAKSRNQSKKSSNHSLHDEWSPRSGFKPIETSSQEFMTSQDSGVKIDTQSTLEEFNEIGSLMQDGLYDECEQLRTVTPSFMKEETVSTSTNTGEADESFNFSSPVRYKDTVFMQSPPGRGIWHSGGKSHHYEWRDTSLLLETVSPENILETRPKSGNNTESDEASTSSIKPMSDILKCVDDNTRSYSSYGSSKPTNTPKQTVYEYSNSNVKQEQQNWVYSPSNNNSYPVSSICSPGVSVFNPACFEQKGNRKCMKYATNMPSYIPSAITSPPYGKHVGSRGKMIKTGPIKVNIVNASSSHVNKHCQNSQINRNQHGPNSFPTSRSYNSQTRPTVYHSSSRAKLPAPQIRAINVPVIPSTMTDTKNKRKRYTPFRSSMSNTDHQNENNDVGYPGYTKKLRTYEDDNALIGFPRVVPLGRTESAGICAPFDREQHRVHMTGNNRRQCAAFIPDSSTSINPFTEVPEVISVKPENLYFF